MFDHINKETVTKAYQEPLTRAQQAELKELVGKTCTSLLMAAEAGDDRVVFKSVSDVAPKIADAWKRIMKDKGFIVYKYAVKPWHYFIKIHEEG